jgi:DNA invertase Pin-like site-specific DNA recombinase
MLPQVHHLLSDRLSNGCIEALTSPSPPFERYSTVLAYRRWSSRHQRGNSSSGRQAGAAEAFAAEHGLVLSPLSCTDDGVSGFSGKNVEAGALGQLLAAVAADAVAKPALLLIEAQDRFGRRPPVETLQRIFGECLEKGLDLYLLDRGLHVTSETVNTDVSVLIRLALEIDAAHRYSERLSRRMRHAHQAGREKIADGQLVRIGWAPEWLDALDAAGVVIPKQASADAKKHAAGWRLNSKAETVLQIVEFAEQGLGQVAIAAELNARGVRPFRFEQSLAAAVAKAQRRAALEGVPMVEEDVPRPAWNPGQIAHVLESPAIAGGRELQRRTGNIAWGYWPGVITRPRWEALRQRLNARAAHQTAGRQSTVKFIGQGLCTCASCGRPVGYRQSAYRPRGHGRKAEPVVKEYVRCRGRIGGQCSAASLPLRDVVAHILTRLGPDQIGELFPVRIGDGTAALRVQITGLRQRREEAAAMAAAGEQQVARALATEPALAAVLGRQVVAAEAEIKAIDAQLLAAEHRLDELRAEQSADGINDLSRQASELLQLFARERDQADDRRRLNTLLRRLGVRLVVDADARRIGMAAGAGALEWRPLAGAGVRAAITMGEVKPLAVVEGAGVGAVLLHGGRESGTDGPVGDQPGRVTLVATADASEEEMDRLMAEAIKQAGLK